LSVSFSPPPTRERNGGSAAFQSMVATTPKPWRRRSVSTTSSMRKARPSHGVGGDGSQQMMSHSQSRAHRQLQRAGEVLAHCSGLSDTITYSNARPRRAGLAPKTIVRCKNTSVQVPAEVDSAGTRRVLTK
jgi:hypothetical protein